MVGTQVHEKRERDKVWLNRGFKFPPLRLVAGVFVRLDYLLCQRDRNRFRKAGMPCFVLQDEDPLGTQRS